MKTFLYTTWKGNRKLMKEELKAEYVNDAKWIHFYGETIEEALVKISNILSTKNIKKELKGDLTNIELKYDRNWKKWKAGCFIFCKDVEEE